MNKSAFLKLIQQVSNISDQQTEELEKVAAAFPYCQTAHLLLAKSAYDKGSMLSTQRLRRASSYATDRQLLKRVIYTSPAPEPVFDTSAVEEEEVAEAIVPVEAVVVSETVSVEEIAEAEEATETYYAEEPLAEQAEEELEAVYASEYVSEEPEYVAAYDLQYDVTPAEHIVEAPEDKLDSELAMLLTFSSLSSSSTDLLSAASVEEQDAADAAPLDHYQETDEALAALLAQEENLEDETDSAFDVELNIWEDEEESFNPSENQFQVTAIVEANVAPVNPEEAEINYSYDEIDRLYAEDALGYWMGSSRMGEVLQLKDDYTRSQPQSFHPELILEYSKTHELEKAIQPASNVLSNQLDIIDQFLKLNPRLKTMANIKVKPEPQEDLSLKSTKIKKGMASESLATIFLKQGKVKKAVKIYEQLILKNPEKKAYFAEQIEKLQNIN